MEKLNVVVLTTEMDLRIHIKNLITNDDIIISGYSDFSSSAILKVQSMFPDVVLCAINGKIEESFFPFVQELFVIARSSAVILMNDSIDVDLVNRAAQVGVRNVVPMDISSEELAQTIHTASNLEKQRTMDTNAAKRVRSKVIGFFGGKGGTGKSTLSVNTAVALAKRGKRVLLIDCDLQFGDVNFFLDLEPKDTIVELVQDRGGINIENINSFTMLHSTGVNVLCAPKSAEYAEFVKGENIETIIDVVRPYFEYIIIDLPPSFNDVSIAGIENCDEVLLVYNMDILSLKNAKVCINILDQLQQKDKVKLILNKLMNGLIKQKDYERLFDVEIYATITMDTKAVTSSLNKGQPIIVSNSRAQVTKDIEALANKIIKNN